MIRNLVLGLVVILLTAGPFALEARVIEVPRDALRLDHALTLAQSGDTVRVAPGRYTGPFELVRNLRLESRRGPGTTVLTAPDAPWVVRSRGGGSSMALAGFTIEGGRVGVDLESGVLQVTRCRVTGADSLGLRCGSGSHARVMASDFTDQDYGVSVEPGADVLLMNCLLDGTGLGVLVSAIDVRILRCRFENNGTAVRVDPTGSARVGRTLREGNDFARNRLAVDNRATVPVLAEANYWGTVDCDSVQALLRGPVVFRPVADAAHTDTLDICR